MAGEITSKKYTCKDGAVFEQKPLVLRQVKQVFGLLEGLDLAALGGEGADAAGLLAALGERAEEFFAIVLLPDGGKVAGKDMAAFQDAVGCSLDAEFFRDVVEDFFTFNREWLARLMEMLPGDLKAALPNLSSSSSASSPGETLPGTTG